MDGLAYDNPAPGRNAYRWQDVEELLAAGITVIGSVNLQHIEDQREAVEKITGKRVTQTIPRAFLNTADEIVIVDAPSGCRVRFTRRAAGDGPPPFRGRHRFRPAELSSFAWSRGWMGDA